MCCLMCVTVSQVDVGNLSDRPNLHAAISLVSMQIGFTYRRFYLLLPIGMLASTCMPWRHALSSVYCRLSIPLWPLLLGVVVA